jgi:endonuclease III
LTGGGPRRYAWAVRRRASARSPSEARRIRRILDGLLRLYPRATCELCFTNPFELLVATILSAQCTDKKVNEVTPALFARYPDAAAMGRADLAVLESMLRPTGFFRMKSRNVQAAARALIERHGGRVPPTMDDLVKLPGVARKTANVVLGTAFGIAEGVVVDTHVLRLARRLALTKQNEPAKVERDLMQKVPRDQWIDFSHRLIWHGRRVCFARAPDCAGCALAPHCPSAP